MRLLSCGSILCSLLLATSVAAQKPPYVDQCNDWQGKRFSVDARIDGCTAAINSGRYRGKDLAWAYDNRGLAWYDKKDLARAIADYDQATQLDPNYAYAYNNRGIAWGDKKDYDRAVADYDNAIRINPRYASAYYNRGKAWSEKKDYDRALADYDEAIRLNPNYTYAYNERGLIWHLRGDYDRAIADYDQAINTDPNYFMPYNNRCFTRAVVGNELQKALADCNESLRLKPDGVNALNSRGLVYLKLRAFDQAITDYSAAITQDAKDADSLYGRGLAKLQSGDTAGGNADVATAKAIDPDIAALYASYRVK
ncbi:MAG: tetratricopeptide repeat protein [Hyphomicrobiales bacterium]|nr:tetratricopeptide repeat protein [Hyphomicrobiales bacterium]MBV8826228.1 tetratricopeptide repeat protein [Hyphomicrobiales bacterium]